MASDTPTKGAESPTTARPLDFDDEQETGVIDSSTSAHAATSASTSQAEATPTKPPRSSSLKPIKMDEEAPPAKPPRPISPSAQNEQILVEAFPGIERQVIKAVLAASGGQIDPAFNALLGMSDPDHVEVEQPPPQPPRRSAQQHQLQQDEMYARQLAEHYAVRDQQRGAQGQGGYPPGQPPQRMPGQEQDDRDYSFFDDDLPRIRENMRQGFLQTQTKFNSWITDLRKRFDGDEQDPYAPGAASQYPPSQNVTQPPRQNFGSSQRDQMHGIQKMAAQRQAGGGGGPPPQGYAGGRRSTDQERYDADPHEIGNFEELELRDEELDEDERPPQKPARPAANPNLFKSGGGVGGGGIAVNAPQSGPVDEVDALYRNDAPAEKKGGSVAAAASGAAAKSKKWQPLTSVAPAPEADADENDPFSVGDEEDEEEKKEKERKKSVDIKKEDTDRLKARAASIDASEKKPGEKKLEPAERSGSVGTRDKAAEDLMKDAAKDESKKEETKEETK